MKKIDNAYLIIGIAFLLAGFVFDHTLTKALSLLVGLIFVFASFKKKLGKHPKKNSRR